MDSRGSVVILPLLVFSFHYLVIEQHHQQEDRR